MSRYIVESLQGNFAHAFGMLEQIIRVCPDELWNKKFGGWPVWQHICHALSAMDFFVMPAGQEPEAAPFSPTVGALAEVADGALEKTLAREYAARMKAKADAYFASLSDDALSAENEPLSQRMGRATSHASTTALLSGHILYHLGSCDAALREHGLQGVF